MTACLSDLRLDERLAGELGGDAAAAAADHLAGCAACRARETALAADRARFRDAQATGGRRRAPWRAAIVGLSAAAAVVIAVAVLPRNTPGDATRSKGGAHLGLVVVHGGAMRIGATGELVHPGDTLQYAVTTDDAAYVTVLGRDAAGRVTTYVPTDRVAGGPNVPLPIATRLDGSLGREEVIAVFCPDATPVGSLHGLPDGCTIDRLAIEKAP